MLTWTYIIVLGILGKHNFKLFTIYTCIRTIEIPTKKGTKVWKQGIVWWKFHALWHWCSFT